MFQEDAAYSKVGDPDPRKFELLDPDTYPGVKMTLFILKNVF
jgi:hypothetical protein